MKLFYSPGACSLSPHIVLRETGVPVTLEKVDLKNGQWSGGDFTKINPLGYVPALQLESGDVLTEGAAIVQFLADKRPETKLLAAVGTMDRVRCIEWLTFVSTELHKGFSPLFNPANSDEVKARAKDLLGKRLSYVDGRLQGRDYLLGAQFSVADAYLFTVLGWTKYVGMDLKSWANLASYVERISQRPKVREALQAEGLI